MRKLDFILIACAHSFEQPEKISDSNTRPYMLCVGTNMGWTRDEPTKTLVFVCNRVFVYTSERERESE